MNKLKLYICRKIAHGSIVTISRTNVYTKECSDKKHLVIGFNDECDLIYLDDSGIKTFGVIPWSILVIYTFSYVADWLKKCI